MQLTLQPLASLANAMGWGWAGGCNNYVGQGFDRVDDGWLAHFSNSSECPGYMSDKRLGIAYADWGFDLVDVIFDKPTQSDLTPELIDSGTLNNWDSDQSKLQTYTANTQRTATVTDTKTSTFNFQSETTLGFSYTPPSVSGGFGFSGSEKLIFGQTNQTGQSTANTETQQSSYQVQSNVPAYARVPWSVILSKAMSSVTYTAIIRPRFSVQLKGFLRWGGNDPNGPDTNYQQDYAGKGDRPITDTKDWAKFGGGKLSFADDLRNKSANRITPWQWDRLLRQHPDVQSYLDFLTNTKNYEFPITGRVDNVQGTRFDVRYEATEYNPAHPHSIARAAHAGEALAASTALKRPVLLTASTV
jgi:hypothetical protein